MCEDVEQQNPPLCPVFAGASCDGYVALHQVMYGCYIVPVSRSLFLLFFYSGSLPRYHGVQFCVWNIHILQCFSNGFSYHPTL